MKIDKIVFACSEAYSPFWYIQSKIWKTKFNIEPVCLLFGDKTKLGLSEEFGQIHEMKFDVSLPPIIQIQFSKFFFPTMEPETTWMIGDMDQIPLQTEHFLKDLDKVSPEAYVHFNYTLCAQMRPLPADVFLQRGAYVNGGYDLPGHYHCAKGKYYKQLFFQDRSFNEVVKYVVDSNRYGMIKEDAKRNLNPAIHGSFWVAEEMYTSEHIWYGYKKKVFDGFYGKEYHIWDGKIDRVGRMGGQWNGSDYVYDAEKLRKGGPNGYVDIHCHRPYHEQEGPLMNVLKIAGMIE